MAETSRRAGPFIIRGRKEEYLLPETDPSFDQSVETKVSFTQACNWFISNKTIQVNLIKKTISNFKNGNLNECKKIQSYKRKIKALQFILIYESVKQFYYVFYYEGRCTDYSRVMIYYMLANSFWVVISLVGATFIRSKQSKKIFIFFVLLIVALLSRIGIYIIMYHTMNHYISEQTLQDCYCKSIYVENLYMLQAIFEGVILLVLIYFVKVIHKYIQNYEQRERDGVFSQGVGGSNVRSRFIGGGNSQNRYN